jgi:hypothetical protein
LASRRLSAGLAGPEHLLAPVRGRWKIEHLHWLPSPGVFSLSHDVALTWNSQGFPARLPA